MVTGGVFISYRGEDSGSYGALLYVELSRWFGPDLVFVDSESLPAGSDFPDQLLARLRRCEVLLAVIGPRWLTAVGMDGQRRIDDPQDWVRRELAEAFAAGMTVIPVLADGATRPTPADLPADIAGLGRLQCRWLRHREATADLARVRTDLAAANPRLAAAARRRAADSPTPAEPLGVVTIRPTQLPLPPSSFTGRTDELAWLLAVDSVEGDIPGAAVFAIDGMPGVGKTALVVHAAHQLIPRYPDGCLFLDLHGHSQQVAPVEPAQALDRMLRALGTPGEQIPPHPDDRAGLYRDRLTGKRMLIVLDDATAADQVRPLLPASHGCLVLITSRRRLTALDEAHPLTIDLLPVPDAVALFVKIAGTDRVAGHTDTVAGLVRVCGQLPLAIRIVAARLRARPAWSVLQLATRISAERTGLVGFDDGERSIAAAFTLSYRDLAREQQSLFRGLGLHPGADFEPYAAAAITDTGPDAAGRLLEDSLTLTSCCRRSQIAIGSTT